MMPAAIVLGFLFHSQITAVEWIVPYLIFCMLLLTFSRIEPRELHFDRAMWLLVAIQIGGAVLLYLLMRYFNVTVAQSAMICVLCPVATAAPVVTGLLGGNVGKVAAFSVISNLSVAVVAPFLFAWVSPQADTGFLLEFRDIALRVTPMIVLPLLVAFALRFGAPQVHRRIAASAPLAFYLWSVSLIIVVGRSVSFVLAEPRSYWGVMVAMALVSAVLCAVQFKAGKIIGARVGDSITYGQSLGQKNTILAIWLAMTYLNGVSSVAPAAYVIWQNSFNSWQMYRKMKKRATAPIK